MTRNTRYTDPEDRTRAKMHAATTQGLAVDDVAYDVFAGRMAVVGHAGTQLGLDLVAGIVWVDFEDYGRNRGLLLPLGTVVVVVWHDCARAELADAARKVDDVIEDHRQAGMLVVPAHGVARWHHYARAWWCRLWRARR